MIERMMRQKNYSAPHWKPTMGINIDQRTSKEIDCSKSDDGYDQPRQRRSDDNVVVNPKQRRSYDDIVGNPKQRRSFSDKIKVKRDSAKKWIFSALPSTSKRNSSSGSDIDDGDLDDVYDFEMKEEFDRDQDIYELIQMAPWDPEDRAKYDDDAVFWYANHHPQAFRVQYDFKEGRWNQTHFPLQRIVSLGASLRTVEAVVRAYPPALFKRHHLERGTTMHAACAYPSLFQTGVVQFLLDLNPSSISQTNKHAFLPIHEACSACEPSPIGLETMQILVEAYPESLSQTNRLGETPLQAAQRNEKFLPDVLIYLEEIQQQQEQQQPE